MIVTEFLNGQGLGNQLWCYAVTRTIALDNGFQFGIMSPNKFKGSEFMDLDFGELVSGGSGPEGGPPLILPDGITNYYMEKRVKHPLSGADISPLDDRLRKIQDNTKIDGVMQSENYIIHRKEEVQNWFKIDEEKEIRNYSSDNFCVIHFRGGDFKGADTTLLSVEYYRNAMNKIKSEHRNINFVIVTDDIILSKQYFPDVEIVGASITGLVDSKKAGHHIGGPIGIDYSIIKNARYLILSNSSFSWWAAWTNVVAEKIIAPKYWARYNVSDGYWSNGDTLTRGWVWLDRNGVFFEYDQCLSEKQQRNMI